MGPAERDHELEEPEDVMISIEQTPIQPGGLVVLIVRVVVAPLCIHELVAGLEERGSVGQHQQTEEVLHIDKPEVKTVSGVSRGEQRKIYDQRRRDALLRKEIRLIEINYYAFEYDSQMNIIRDKEKDIEILKEILKDFIK